VISFCPKNGTAKNFTFPLLLLPPHPLELSSQVKFSQLGYSEKHSPAHTHFQTHQNTSKLCRSL